MIKEPEMLKNQLLDYLKSELISSGKDGIVVHLDGTLMSLVNVKLAQQLMTPFKYKVVVCMFNQNRTQMKQLISMIKDLEIIIEQYDLEQDFSALSLYKHSGSDVALEIAIKRRFTDLTLNITGDKSNCIPVSNLSYSQWCINFPHVNYKNREHLHLLNRLFYSEIVELAKHLGIRDLFINREPTHYLYIDQQDATSLGFTYSDQEQFLREPEIKSLTHKVLQDKIVVDDMIKYRGPFLTRPSNLLG